MPYFEFLWTEEIVDHLAEHGVTREDFEEAVSNADRIDMSRSSGRPCCLCETADGRRLFCVYEHLHEITIIPVTAYEVPD